MNWIVPYLGSFRSMLRLGGPLILSQLALMGIGVTDSIMLGWYSVEALAAGVLGHTVFFVIFIVGGGFGMAIMPLVASAVARDAITEARRVTRMGLWLSIAYAAAVLPAFIYSEPLLVMIRQPAELAQLASRYLAIVGFAMVPALIVLVLKSYLSAQELMRFALLTTIIGFIVNIPLNYVLIFGKLGVPELGVEGSAIASFLVNSLMAICLCIYAAIKLPEQALFQRIWRPDWASMGTVTKLGLPISVTSLAEAGLFSASTLMMGWLGTVAVAAHGIALSITSLTFVIHVGLSSAATIQVGHAFGANRLSDLKRSTIVASCASAVIVALTVLMFLSMPEFLVSLYIDPMAPELDEILIYGTLLLFMAALFSTVDAAQVMALGMLRGIQDTSVPMGMAIVSYWIIGIPVAYWLAFTLEWGGVGLWAGLAIGLACASFGLIGRFLILYRKLHAKAA